MQCGNSESISMYKRLVRIFVCFLTAWFWLPSGNVPAQSVTDTPTPTPTHTMTVTPTSSVTVTATLTTTATVSPSATLTTTLTPQMSATASPTLTPASSVTPSPTATFATALPATATQPVETFEPQESEGPPLVITQTATLAPLPVVTYQVSQLTPSPELLILAHQPGSPDLPKEDSSQFWKGLARWWPIPALLAAWLILALWFILAQRYS
jgi:hypothetical protein